MAAFAAGGETKTLFPVDKIENEVMKREDEEEKPEDYQEFDEHQKLHRRLSRNLYYGQRSCSSSYRLSLPITELCVENFNGRGVSGIEAKLDRLNLTKAAKVAHDTTTTPTSLVLALLYLERIRGSNPAYLSSVSSADLFLVSLMVASKYLHDDGEEDEVFNEDWAASGGMDKKELNRMEMEFLTSIDWRLHATQAEFEVLIGRLETAVVRRQLALRRWSHLTYSDAVVLAAKRMFAWGELLLAVKVTAVIVAAYAASVATMVGTCHLLNSVKLGPNAISESVSTIVTTFETKAATAATEDFQPDFAPMNDEDEDDDTIYHCEGTRNETAAAAVISDVCKLFSAWSDGNWKAASNHHHHQTFPIHPVLDPDPLLLRNQVFLSTVLVL